MKFINSNRHPVSFLVGLLMLGFITRLVVISLPMDILVNTVVADDAFYYFSLARNITNGNGVVFNLGVPTNGFHPLYAGLLIPIFEILTGTNNPIRASLLLLSVFNTLTAVPIYFLCVELRSKIAGLFAASLWVLNPYIIKLSLTGVEVSVQIFFVSILTWYLVSRQPSWRSMGRSGWIITGTILAITFLSRMDMAFLALGVFAAYGGYILYRYRGIKIIISEIQHPFEGGVVASGLILPWLVWSYQTVGQVTPISGEVLRWEFRQYPYRYGSYMDTVLLAIGKTGQSIWSLLIFPYNPSSYFMLGVLDTAALTLILLIIWTIYKFGWLRSLISQLDFLILATLLWYPYYWFYQTDMRPWYGLFTIFIFTILFSVFSSALNQRFAWNEKIFIRIFVVGLVILFTISGGVYVNDSTEIEGIMYESNYINENIPEESTVASFNTGKLQYFTPKHDVLNLDGLMNPEAAQARQGNSIPSYFCKNDINYVIDPDRDIKHLERNDIKLHHVKTFDSGSKRKLYHIVRIPECEQNKSVNLGTSRTE